VDRTLAMLVLTAIHDIMKVQALLPIVAEKHAGFCGYKAFDKISDHDAALGYVLTHYPELLPSVNILPQAQRRSITFTQSKMEFNMGWLVQAEAPPGALFAKFKECITNGSASQKDVSFYFVHWLTDLAAAEPYPQDGCEKFVLKFPQKVLTAFLNSFTTVQRLSTHTETQVFEEYLLWRWRSTEESSCGAPPHGPGSIAKLRLAVMAQGDSKRILDAYEQLPKRDERVLSEELARTGAAGQAYQCDHVVAEGGPAFLVYYAPALMQKAASVDPGATLSIFAEVLRKSRSLFPVDRKRAGEAVIVRIDSLKDLQAADITQPKTQGDVWLITKLNDREAAVSQANLLEEQPNWESSRALFCPDQNDSEPSRSTTTSRGGIKVRRRPGRTKTCQVLDDRAPTVKGGTPNGDDETPKGDDETPKGEEEAEEDDDDDGTVE